MAQADRSASTVVPNATGFQRDLLFTLAAIGPAKGLAVKQRLETYYGEEINHGRLYPNLDDLDDRGLVDKRTGEDDRSKAYALTERGKSVVVDRTEWEQVCLEEVDA